MDVSRGAGLRIRSTCAVWRGREARGVSRPLLIVAMSRLCCVVACLMVVCHTHETKAQPAVGERAIEILLWNVFPGMGLSEASPCFSLGDASCPLGGFLQSRFSRSAFMFLLTICHGCNYSCWGSSFERRSSKPSSAIQARLFAVDMTFKCKSCSI